MDKKIIKMLLEVLVGCIKDRDIYILELKLDHATKAIKRAFYYLEDGDDFEAKQDMRLTYQFLTRK